MWYITITKDDDSAHNLDHSAAGTRPRHQPTGLDRGNPRVISEDDVTFLGSRTSLWHFTKLRGLVPIWESTGTPR